MSQYSDEELYARMKIQGDLGAFDALYARHKNGLFRFVRRYLSDEAETEEIFQEAFLQVLRAPTLDFSNGSFQGWIYLIARNLCLNRIRAAKRGRHAVALASRENSDGTQHGDGSEGRWDGVSASASPSPEELWNERDVSRRLGEAARGLPEILAEVLRLRLAGHANGDIARKLGIPLGTVKSRFHAIVAHLKQEIIR